MSSGEPAPEEQFGPYLVYERLGVGGMATVHRALEHSEEDGSDRIVALKRLLPHLAEDASFIKSFVREAKLASILNHVNIVQIYELGRVGTEYFISMEYIDGRDLRRMLRHARKVTGPPPINVTVGLMIQLCDALDYAHNKVDEDGHPLGLVHRDISPSNLIVTSTGQVKIIDFGIAKAQSSQLRTQTGRVKGKLAYMAPEAVSGSRDLDARSDIWATGVIVHELCTARPLFASKNEYQTLLKVQRGDILPPSTFNQSCPPELDAIVFRALARDPDDRFASAADLREELLALKKQYSLQTSYKDVSGWIDWAFGQEAPDGLSADSAVMSMNTSRVHAKTPRPPRDQEEDEAVEVVWGGGSVESENGPVVLEEVPDVSTKHRAKRDTEDDSHQVDDIPTPLPSHGTMPSIYGKEPRPSDPEIVVVPQRPDPRLFGAEAALGRGTDQPAPPRAVVPMPARSRVPTGIQPPITRTVTGPQPLTARTTSGTPRQGPASSSAPLSSSQAASARERRPTAPGVDAPQLGDRMAAQRERDIGLTGETPSLDSATVLDQHDTVLHGDSVVRAQSQGETVLRAGTLGDAATNPVGSKALSAEELFGNDAANVLNSVSAQMEVASTHVAMSQFNDEPVTSPTMKPIQNMPTVPVVRFSKSNSIPPANVNDASGALDPLRSVQTRPGVGIAAVSPSAPRAVPSSSRPPTNLPVEPVTTKKSGKTLLFVLAGVLLAGGTATLVALAMSGGADGSSDPTSVPAPPAQPVVTPQTPPPASQRVVGKLRFDLEPTDAEIKIEGAPVHAGSPWSTELPPGIHQVEIHRNGYKSWLTSVELSANETASLRVVLEPITSAITGDATLRITTTPPGLDVLIDGKPFADKTPIKTTLTVGTHKIAVRQNGAEVWQQNLNAEAASDYEFNPSFTDDKKRERAQRTTPPRPVQRTTPVPRPSPDTATTPQTGSATAPQTGSATAPQTGSASAPQTGSASAPQTGSATVLPPPPTTTTTLDKPATTTTLDKPARSKSTPPTTSLDKGAPSDVPRSPVPPTTTLPP